MRPARVQAPAGDDALCSTSRWKSGGGRTCGDRQQLRWFGMEFMNVECHLCAGKQVRIVKIAHPQQGSGRGKATLQ